MALSVPEVLNDLMERIRQDFLAGESFGASDRAVLLQVTSMFERVIWITQRLARVIQGGQPDALGAVA
jgi:hypothetical protein